MFAKQSERKNMLIYNTTYQVEEGQEDNFLIWIKEFYLPEVEKAGALHTPRIVRVLSHREEGSTCYSLQFDILVRSQFDRMLDRQIRSLIEYEWIHRKVSNFGVAGKIFSLLFGGKLFVAVKVWYPMKQKVGSEFFMFKKRYSGIYDTYALFSAPDQKQLS